MQRSLVPQLGRDACRQAACAGSLRCRQPTVSASGTARTRTLAAASTSSQSTPLLATFAHGARILHVTLRDAIESFLDTEKEVYGITASVDEVEHHGSTDLLIILALLEYKGIKIADAIPRLPRAAEAMVEFCEKNVAEISEGLELLPGVEELLSALAGRQNTVTALVTGNLEPIGWAKMEALGLKQYFTTPLLGGFSSDYCSNQLEDYAIDRAEFIRVAKRKALATQKFTGGTPRIVHFGDTPNDVKAAVAAGAVPVGLATGAFSLDQLRASARKLGAEESLVLLPDLRDTKGVLEAIEAAAAAAAQQQQQQGVPPPPRV